MATGAAFPCAARDVDGKTEDESCEISCHLDQFLVGNFEGEALGAAGLCVLA